MRDERSQLQFRSGSDDLLNINHVHQAVRGANSSCQLLETSTSTRTAKKMKAIMTQFPKLLQSGFSVSSMKRGLHLRQDEGIRNPKTSLLRELFGASDRLLASPAQRIKPLRPSLPNSLAMRLLVHWIIVWLAD